MAKNKSNSNKQSEALADLQNQAAKIYTPGKPITEAKLFSGREAILKDLKNSLLMSPTSLIIYGERGVGKTSFCNIVLEGYRYERHNCSKEDDFVTIFLNILTKLGEQFTEGERKILAEAGYSIGDNNLLSVTAKIGGEDLIKPIADRRLDLNFVLNKFGKVKSQLNAIILDEFQNITNPKIQTQIIEVVKGFADNDIPVMIIISGVANLDTELLTSEEYPQYKLRHFTAVKLPRMQVSEIRDIIDKRKTFGIQVGDEEKDSIAQIASGYPTYAHRLALNATFNCLRRNISEIVRIFLSSISIFGFKLSRLFRERKVDLKKIDIKVIADDLSESIMSFIREFNENYKKTFDGIHRAIESHKGTIVWPFLQLLAKSEADEISKNQILQSTDMSESELDNIIEVELSSLVRQKEPYVYSLAYRNLRPYLRALEFIRTEHPTLWKDLGFASND
jgi:AAA+ ATPase superfamily predicted ATPase